MLTFSYVLTDVGHSQRGAQDVSTETFANGTVYSRPYSYTENWIVTSFRHDALLGIPWHTEENPEADYSALTTAVGYRRLDAIPISRRPALHVTNIEVKKKFFVHCGKKSKV